MDVFESNLRDPAVQHEARCLPNEMMQLEFLISLLVLYDILFQANIVNKQMQSRTMDIAVATASIELCQRIFWKSWN